jgi:hypothetical protein
MHAIDERLAVDDLDGPSRDYKRALELNFAEGKRG